MACTPSEDSDQPCHPPIWSESSLSAWRKLWSLATHWAHSEDSDQTWRMPRLVWVFAGRTVTLLVMRRLLWSSNYDNRYLWKIYVRYDELMRQWNIIRKCIRQFTYTQLIRFLVTFQNTIDIHSYLSDKIISRMK